MAYNAAQMGGAKLKGLVLSGGKGSRLRPFTYTGAKQLVPVANKPVLFYAIEQLVASGIDEIGIITGDTGAEVREALGDGSRFGCRFTFIPQEAPLGVAHAVKIAQPFMGDAPFVVFLGDNFLRGGIERHVEAFRESHADAMVLLAHVANPRDFGVAVLDGEGKLTRLIEKPVEPPTDLAVIGLYMFSPRFFEAAGQITPSARGELEITDAIQKLVDLGGDVRATVIDGDWIDTGRMGDILAANRIVLSDVEPTLDGAYVDERSKIEGRVVLQAGARIVNSTIVGPAIVGENTEVVDSRIGPFVSIYHHCRVNGAEIESSIVLERSVIDRPGAKIQDSLIGRDVTLEGGGKALRLVIGDHSQMELS